MRDVGIGLVLTATMVGITVTIWDSAVVLSTAAFGILATAIHVTAVALLKAGLKESFRNLMMRWTMGMGLRLLGVALFAAAVTIQGDRFPAVPSAIGYIGVLLPLMATEMRLIR